jgi:hypothetical protein
MRGQRFQGLGALGSSCGPSWTPSGNGVQLGESVSNGVPWGIFGERPPQDENCP